MSAPTTRTEQLQVALRIGIAVSLLTTATIHYSLGGLLFLLNAVGYVVLFAAYLAPFAFFQRYRFLTRLAIIGYTAATIGGWLIMGPYFSLAYLTKAIEVLLIGMTVADLFVSDGGVQGVLGKARERFASIRTHGLAGI